jgi:hypothetical protein
MMPNHYDRERMAQAHRQELLHEAEQQRQVAQLSLPRRSVSPFPAQLVLSLRALSIRLQKRFKRHIA